MIIAKILMTLSSSFKYFINARESTQPNERILTNLISRLINCESVKKTRTREPKKGQRTLLLLPISISVRKISKKATLD